MPPPPPPADRGTTRLSIGAFSRRSLLSQKALRLYDKQGLLPPAFIDPHTGYRSYTTAQLPDARLIARLRRIDMPLDRIAAVLRGDPAERAAAIAAYWEEVCARHDQRGRIVAQLLRTVALTHGDLTMNDLPIHQRTIPAQTVLSEQRHLSVEELPAWSDETSRRLLALACAHDAEAGPVFLLFHGELSEEGDGPLELCVPVDPARMAGVDVPMRTLPARQEAYLELRPAQMRYPAIVTAHDAVEAWIGAQGGHLAGPAREIYYPSFGRAAEDEIVGEVAYAFSRD